jgi:hypothetical protein
MRLSSQRRCIRRQICIGTFALFSASQNAPKFCEIISEIFCTAISPEHTKRRGQQSPTNVIAYLHNE